MTTKELIEKTKELIRIPSTADNLPALRKVFEVVEAMVTTHPNIKVEYFEQNGKPSLLAYRGGKRPKEFDVILNAHLDVVPAPDQQFEPYVKNGRLYGRGALDMKGTAVVMTDVFCEMFDKVPYNLALQIVTDEELGGYDCTRLQISEGVRAKFVIMGEYANDRHTIYNAARGLCWAELLFNGKTAHGGHLWHGTNAVVRAGNFAAAVLEHYPTPDKETWTTTASIASLSTPNETYNKVPDQATLKIDFRFTQEDPVFQTRSAFAAFVQSIDPDAQLVNLATFEPAVHVDALNPYVQGISAAMYKVTGKRPRFLGRPAGSDGRHYALVENDIVEFGVYGQHSHGDDEYVEIASFEEYQAILKEFLRQPVPKKLETPTLPAEPLQEQLLRQLVAIPSVPTDRAANNKVLDLVANFVRKRGMHVERFEQNKVRSIIATTRPNTKRPTILLNAHSDVVPGPDELFDLKLQDGKFIGRGVMDMKHAIAAYLTVVDRLKDELDTYDFGLMINSDEELGGENGAKPLVEQLGYGAKVVLVPDGGNHWELEHFAKGIYWIKLEAIGKEAHASRPWEGESAIHRLLGAIKDIRGLVADTPKPEDTLLSVGTIEGGKTANQLAAHATAMLDVRTGSIADHERIIKDIAAICDAHSVTMEITGSGSPIATDPKAPYIKEFVDIVEAVTGTEHPTRYDFAVTDGRFFSGAGIPTIVINPECDGIHTPEEWLSQQSFAQFCDVIEQYVRNIARQKTQKSTKPSHSDDILALAQRLQKPNKALQVWYVNYGSGLAYQNFLSQIQGGHPLFSANLVYTGCTDQTPPLRDYFMSIPYRTYFDGVCDHWGGGGYMHIESEPSADARTVARAYLITLDQFEDLAAQQNDHPKSQALPLRQALLHGHATIGDGSGPYDELVFCGMNDGHPLFTLTATQSSPPYQPPNDVYARLLSKGLSEHADLDPETAIEYMLSWPGFSDHFKKRDVARFFQEVQDESPKATSRPSRRQSQNNRQ